MKLEDLNKYPEYPNKSIVEQFCNLVLDQAEKKTIDETLCDLRYLGDKQYHTYEPASETLRERIKKWLIQSGAIDATENCIDILVISYYFSLDKDFYLKILEKYNGQNKMEFVNNLQGSLGDFLDPWWDLKKNN